MSRQRVGPSAVPAGEAELNNVGPAGLSPHSEKKGRALLVPFVAPKG